MSIIFFPNETFKRIVFSFVVSCFVLPSSSYASIVDSTSEMANYDISLDDIVGASSDLAGSLRSSRMRTAINGGGPAGSGGSVRYPVTNIQLFSITPPSFSAGCGGVSWHFGGFTYISGEQIEQLIQNILQNSKGLVVQMGIQTLCGVCADILGKMETLARAASAMSLDSCKMAGKLTNMAFGDDGLLPFSAVQDSARKICARDKAGLGSNASEDTVSATEECGLDPVSKSIGSIADFIEGKFGRDTPDGKAEKAKRLAESLNLGNKMYAALREQGYTRVQAQFLLNLIGYQWSPAGYGATEAQVKEGAENAKIVIGNALGSSMDDVVNFYLYGYGGYSTCNSSLHISDYIKDVAVRNKIEENMNNAKQVADFFPYSTCAHFRNGTRVPSAEKKSIPYGCEYTVEYESITSVPINELPIPQCGYLPSIYVALEKGLEATRNGDPLPVEAVEAISVIDIPLYQIIKITRVYPDAGESILSEYIPLIASKFVKIALNRLIFSGRGEKPSIVTKALNTAPLYSELSSQLMQMQQLTSKSLGSVISNITYTQGLISNIRQINKLMNEEAVSGSMSSIEVYSSMVSSSAIH